MAKRVEVDIHADASGVRRGAAEASAALGRLNSTGAAAMSRLRDAGRLAGFAIGTGLAMMIATGTHELIQQEKVSGRTANVIETTGQKAGITAKQVEDLASSLQDLTGSHDDVIQSGENVLLLFTKIKAGGPDQIFERATAAANDMSVAMGKDMSATARGLGKALNDPIKGLGLLGRAGVTFTTQQKEQFKTWVEHGDILKAQNAILASVEERFKGAAQSEGQITEATQQASVKFQEFSEGLAGRVLPAVIALAGFIKDNATAFEVAGGAVAGAAAGYLLYTAATTAATLSTGILTGAVAALNGTLAISPIGAFVALVAVLGAGFVLLSTRSSSAEDAQRDLAEATRDAASASRDAAAAIDAQAAALDRIIGSNLDEVEAKLRVKQATADLAVAEATYGKGSKEAEQAARDLTRAQLDLNRIKRDHTAATRDSVAETKKAIAQTDKEIDSAKRAVDVARSRVTQARAMGASAKDLAPLQRTLATAEKNLADKSGDAATKLAESAKNAKKAADASGDATPKARALRDELNRLAKVQINAALAIALRNIGSAADTAAGGVANVVGWLERLNNTPRGGGGDFGTPKKKSTATGAKEDERLRVLGGPPVGKRGQGGPSPISVADRLSLGISARHRDDTLQDMRAREIALAHYPDVTNPAKLEAIGEKAELKSRQEEIDLDLADTRSAIRKINTQIRGKRRTLIAKKKKRRNVKGKTPEEIAKKKAALTEEIRAIIQAITELFDTRRSLNSELAELQAQADEIGYRIDVIGDINAMPDVEPVPPEEPDAAAAAAAAAADPNVAAALGQAEARAARAEAAQRGSESFIDALRGSGSIDPAGGAVTIYVAGSLVQESQVGSWIVDALGRQPGATTSIRMSPA